MLDVYRCRVLTHEAADLLAQQAHGTERTRAGILFIDHVRRVASSVTDDPDPDAVLAALLHDTVEKGSLSWDDLRAAGAHERLVDVVDALTERDGETLEEYLARCAADPLALRIKRADIGDKLTLTELDVHPTVLPLLRERALQRLRLLDELAGLGRPSDANSLT